MNLLKSFISAIHRHNVALSEGVQCTPTPTLTPLRRAKPFPLIAFPSHPTNPSFHSFATLKGLLGSLCSRSLHLLYQPGEQLSDPALSHPSFFLSNASLPRSRLLIASASPLVKVAAVDASHLRHLGLHYPLSLRCCCLR